MALAKDKKITAEEFFAMFRDETNSLRELLNGEIVLQAAPNTLHQRLTRKLVRKTEDFILSRRGDCEVFNAPYDVVLDDNSVVQPDILVVCDPSKIDDKRCSGPPDFVIEILSENRDDDLGRKYMLYKECGVREYWIVDPVNSKTVVYFWDKSDLPNIYTFSTPIPVGIYGGELEISIEELLAQ